jgi:hypothetical protein
VIVVGEKEGFGMSIASKGVVVEYSVGGGLRQTMLIQRVIEVKYQNGSKAMQLLHYRLHR